MLIQQLREGPKGQFALVTVGDPEATSFAKQLILVLQDAGWTKGATYWPGTGLDENYGPETLLRRVGLTIRPSRSTRRKIYGKAALCTLLP